MVGMPLLLTVLKQFPNLCMNAGDSIVVTFSVAGLATDLEVESELFTNYIDVGSGLHCRCRYGPECLYGIHDRRARGSAEPLVGNRQRYGDPERRREPDHGQRELD